MKTSVPMPFGRLAAPEDWCPGPSGAVIDGEYRYLLWRVWDRSLPLVSFCMVNPSTAGPIDDDQTIRKCCSFTRLWGYGGVVVVNLFALRSTDPSVLKTHQAPIGPKNDSFIREAVQRTKITVAAWGRPGGLFDRDRAVRRLMGAKPLLCLGQNQDGTPKHPCYLSLNTELSPYV